MFQENIGLGIPRAIHSKDKSLESLRPQQMGPRGMNVIDMTVKLHLSLSSSVFGSFSYKEKRKRKKSSQNDSAIVYFLIEETP